MSDISSYLEEKILNHVFRNTAYTPPAVVYVGLASSVATDEELEAGTLTNEITGYDGVRKEITFGEPAQIEGKATIKNTGLIEFTNMPACIVKYAIICDASTAGNILYKCLLSPARELENGDTINIPIDELALDLD